MQNNKSNAGWDNEELDLIKDEFRKGTSLNRLEFLLSRTKTALCYKLYRLARLNPATWYEIYDFYQRQLYEQNKQYLINYQNEYYCNHKREMKRGFRKYYKKVSSRKPHKKEGESLKSIILRSKYGKNDDFLSVFAHDLIKLGIIKDTSTFYHWIEGYFRPRRSFLSELSRTLNQNQKILEDLFYSN